MVRAPRNVRARTGYTLREAIENLRMKRFEIDTLMLVAAGGAAALGDAEQSQLKPCTI